MSTLANAEIDLHELTAGEALRVFVEFYNARLKAGQRGPITVIHGYLHGDRIRRRLHAFLAQHGDALEYVAGEKFAGNPGQTCVYPKAALPTTEDRLAQDIRAYCLTPKNKERILGKFRRYDRQMVLSALDALIRQGELREGQKGGVSIYISG